MNDPNKPPIPKNNSRRVFQLRPMKEEVPESFVAKSHRAHHDAPLTFEPWTKRPALKCVTIQIKGTAHYFHVVQFILLYKVVQTFESVGEILKCDHSVESYLTVLTCDAVYYAVRGGSNF